MPTTTQKRFLLAVWCLAASLAVLAYIRVSGFEPTYFPEQIGKPFAYRVMAATLVRMIAPLFPVSIFGQLDFIQQLSQGSTPNYGFAAFLVLYTAMLLTGWGIYTLMKALGYVRQYRLLAVGLFCLLTCTVFAMVARLYDLPHAAIMIWALVFLYRRNIPAFFLLFVPGAFSRETIIFLIPLYFLLEPSWRRAGASAILFTIFLLVRAYISTMLTGIPESDETYGWALFLQVGLTPVFLIQHVLYLFLLLIAFAGWPQKPAFLRLAFSVLMSASILAYFVAGYPGEVRVFMEASLVLVMMYMPVSRQLPAPAYRMSLEDGRTNA